MHTVIVIAIGLAVLGAGLLLGHVLGDTAGMARAALYFLPVWLIGAGINMYFGVHGAGYAVRDEAPILLIVFAVPPPWRCCAGGNCRIPDLRRTSLRVTARKDKGEKQ